MLDPVEAPPLPPPAAQTEEATGKAGEDGVATDAPVDAGEAEATDDAANAGIRQEPELGAHENIAPDSTPKANEFDFDRNDAQEDATQARRQADRLMRRNARNASLDPDDGLLL